MTPPLQLGVPLAFRTREEASGLAGEIAALLADPPRARMALEELMLNAIEHGNLAIGGRAKADLLRAGRFGDEIRQRLDAMPFAERRAHVTVTRQGDQLEIAIRDEGSGFAWREFIPRDGVSDAPNGRGIALARTLCFPNLTYVDPGNVVVVRGRSAS